MYQEVRDHRLQLQRRGGRHRAAAHVHLHRDVVRVRVIANFLAFGDAADQAQVRLDHVQRLLLEVLPVPPAGVQALARRHRNPYAAGHLLLKPHVQVVHRLFVVHAVQVFPYPPQLDARGSAREGVDLQDDVHVRSDGIPDGLHTVVEEPQLRIREHRPQVGTAVPLRVQHDRVDLHAVVPLGHRLPGGVRVLLCGPEALEFSVPAELNLARVRAQFVVCLAAEQLIHGHAECLALDVPHGYVDRAHAPEHDRAATLRPERRPEHRLPQLLALKRVDAQHERLGQVLRHAGACAVAYPVRQPHLAHAADALVGVHTDQHRVPRRGFLHLQVKYLYARDLHSRSPVPGIAFIPRPSRPPYSHR